MSISQGVARMAKPKTKQNKQKNEQKKQTNKKSTA